MPHFKELFRAWKAWRKSGWLQRYLGMGNYSPTLEHQQQFDNLEFVRGEQMSDKDLIDKAKGNYPKVKTEQTGNLFPVRIYDAEGNLKEVVEVEELKKKGNRDLKEGTGWRKQHYKKRARNPTVEPLTEQAMNKLVEEVENKEEGKDES